MPLALSTFGWIVVVAVLSVLFVAWLYCLFAVLARSDLGGGTKVLWVLALIVLAPFAIVGYLLFGRERTLDGRMQHALAGVLGTVLISADAAIRRERARNADKLRLPDVAHYHRTSWRDADIVGRAWKETGETAVLQVMSTEQPQVRTATEPSRR